MGREKSGSGLVVETNPPGARVIIDGKDKGKSPLTDTGLSPGQVTVKVELAGYEPAEMPVTVREGKQTPVKFTLIRTQNYGSLKVASDPKGAQWYLDGAYAGLRLTPCARSRPGRTRYRSRRPGSRSGRRR